MKLFLKQSRKTMFVVLVLMLTLTFVSAVPAYGASVAIDATNFPDDVFRDYVKKNFDKNHNDMLRFCRCFNCHEKQRNRTYGRW